ncbi:MAG: glycosyltransferase [Chlamydiae bacterium]|nr:glycosyltransferase [Chlamydiota bacterium]
MSHVTLSVILVNYNYGHYITESTNAILSQSRLPEEFIIIDDASTDNSWEIITNLTKGLSFVKIIRHKINQGVMSTVNEGIKMATKDYLFLTASDDKMLPGFIEKNLTFLLSHPNVGAVSSIPGFFNNDNPFQVEFFPMGKNENRVFSAKEIIDAFKYQDYWIPGHTTILKTNLAQKFGGLNEKFKHSSDWFLNTQIALTNGMGYLSEPLAAMRIHGVSYSAKAKENPKELDLTFLTILRSVDEDFDSEFRQSFIRSNVIHQLGLKMIKFLVFHPEHWYYLPQLFIRKIRSLFRKKIYPMFFKKNLKEQSFVINLK